jgi:hypothetical protein
MCGKDYQVATKKLPELPDASISRQLMTLDEVSHSSQQFTSLYDISGKLTGVVKIELLIFPKNNQELQKVAQIFSIEIILLFF